MKIFVVGNGAFGTAVAEILARAGHETMLWCSTHDYPHLELMLKLQRLAKKENYLYLPKVELNSSITFTDEFGFADVADVVLLTQPTKFLWASAEPMFGRIEKNPKMTIALLSKGFDDYGRIPWGIKLRNYLKLTHHFYNFAVISGPTFAQEIIKPYQVHQASAASSNLAVIKKLHAAFKKTNLQLFGTTDLVGVSWGGGLKNAYAIGYGLILKQAGENAAWEYIWLNLQSEIKMFLEFAGARAKTLTSHAVFGDFYVTCRGASRNRKFGEDLAKYLPRDEILKCVRGGTVEGYESMMTLWKIAQGEKLDMPFLHSIHAICEFGASPDTFVECFERVKAASRN